MSDLATTRTSWILWPFHLVWRLVTLVVALTGRLVCAILGLVLVAGGSAATMTVVGAPLGIPVAAIGLLLLIRSIF